MNRPPARAAAIFICILISSPIFAAIDSTLVLNMPCANSGTDLSIYGNTGTLINTTPAPDRFGHAGQALWFNGSTSKIVVPNSASMNPDHELTIAFWIQFDTTGANYLDVFCKGGPVTPGFTNREYSLYLKANLGPRYFQLMSSGDGGEQHQAWSYSFVPGHWVFFTGIIDRKNHIMATYINGVAQSDYSFADSYSSFTVNEYNLWIGASEEGFVDHTPFRGTLDEIRMYRRVLSPNEILALYATPADTLPHLEVSAVHDFGAVLAGSPAYQQILLRNTGVSKLIISNMSCSSPRFHLSDSLLTLEGFDSAFVMLAYTPAISGRDTAHITIASNDPLSPSRVIPLAGTGVIPERAPVILSIRDIPSDQGNQVRVLWLHSKFDGVSDSLHAQFYDLWRRIPFPGAGWDFIGSVPAVHMQEYGYIAPTLADSGATGGIPWSVFRVSTRFQEAVESAFSAPDSGYSTDNIPPGKVTGVLTSVTGGRTALFWDPVADADVVAYEIFVSATYAGSLGGMRLAGTTRNLMFVDSTTVLGPVTYYRIAAVDRAGSIGTPSDLIIIRTTDVTTVQSAPATFGLDQNYPNPFNPTTGITYRVATAGPVRLSVFDVLGRDVARLVSEHKEPGTYVAQFDARGLASGMYLYRMTAGSFVQTRTMLLVR